MNTLIKFAILLTHFLAKLVKNIAIKKGSLKGAAIPTTVVVLKNVVQAYERILYEKNILPSLNFG